MPTNSERADKADKALQAYTEVEGGPYAREPIYDRIRDLITDLCHLMERDCPEEGDESTLDVVDIRDRFNMSVDRYAEEREEDD